MACGLKRKWWKELYYPLFVIVQQRTPRMAWRLLDWSKNLRRQEASQGETDFGVVDNPLLDRAPRAISGGNSEHKRVVDREPHGSVVGVGAGSVAQNSSTRNRQTLVVVKLVGVDLVGPTDKAKGVGSLLHAMDVES